MKKLATFVIIILALSGEVTSALAPPAVPGKWQFAPAQFIPKDCSNQRDRFLMGDVFIDPFDDRFFLPSPIEAANTGWNNFVDCTTKLGFKSTTASKEIAGFPGETVLYGNVHKGEIPTDTTGTATSYWFEGYSSSDTKGLTCVKPVPWLPIIRCSELPSRVILYKKYFPDPQYSLNISRGGNGSGTVKSISKIEPGAVKGPDINCGNDCQGSYFLGTEITISAIPNPDSVFLYWSGPTSQSKINCSGWSYQPEFRIFSPSCNIVMLKDQYIVANFAKFSLPPPPLPPPPPPPPPPLPPTTFSLDIQKTGDGSGIVNGPNINCGTECFLDFASGAEITLSAAPAEDSVFDGWSKDCNGTNSCVLTFNSNKSVLAQFNKDVKSKQKFSLNVSKTGSGNGRVTGQGIDCGADCFENYPEGQQITLSATAKAGSAFDGWSGACFGKGSCSITMDASKLTSAKFRSTANFFRYIREILPF